MSGVIDGDISPKPLQDYKNSTTEQLKRNMCFLKVFGVVTLHPLETLFF